MSTKSARKVYKAIIDRAKILTECVKLIFGKSHKFVGQLLIRFKRYAMEGGGVILTPFPPVAVKGLTMTKS